MATELDHQTNFRSYGTIHADSPRRYDKEKDRIKNDILEEGSLLENPLSNQAQRLKRHLNSN
ncbi:unnamed protein product [Acidithrix sp. C25]|nr:unnamed protein product [Acidithrix sp. C25]